MSKLSAIGGLFDLDRLEEDIAAYEQEMSEPSFWDDSEKANQVIQKNNELKSIYDTFHKMELAHEETSLLFEMYKEEPDEEVHAEIVEAIQASWPP